MCKEILSDMKRDFSADPKYWDWLASLEMTDSVSEQEKSEDIMPSQLQKAVQVYEEALKNVPSSMMFDQYTKFLMDIIASKSEEAKVSQSPKHVEQYVSLLLTVYEKADAMGCMTEDIACRYLSLYLQLGRLDEARKIAVKLCSGKLSNSVQLWLLRVSVVVRCSTRNVSSPSKADMLSIFELLRSILTRVSVSGAESLWLMALKFFINQKNYFERLVEISLVSVVQYGGGEYGFSLPFAIINIVLQKDGIQQAREMYKRFLALPRPGLVVYQKCIELEFSLASAGDKYSLVNARKLFELALSTYDQIQACGEITTLWRLSWELQKLLLPSIGVR